MTRLYGHKFTSSYGTSDDGTWLMALDGLSKSDLSRGLSILMNIPNEWPPSVPKFKQLCLGVDSEEIKIRAKRLAIEDAGGYFNYKHFTTSQCRSAIREMLSKATKQLMEENISMSRKGTLDENCKKKLSTSSEQLKLN